MRERERRRERERERERQNEMPGFSRATVEIGRRKCIGKASGREHVNAIINYPFRAREGACTRRRYRGVSRVPRIRGITGSSFNDRDSLSIRRGKRRDAMPSDVP